MKTYISLAKTMFMIKLILEISCTDLVSKSKKKVQVKIAVAVSVCVLAVLALLGFFFWRRKRTKARLSGNSK
jgi:hypothetical protein